LKNVHVQVKEKYLKTTQMQYFMGTHVQTAVVNEGGELNEEDGS
jgi:hypothetical protein